MAAVMNLKAGFLYLNLRNEVIIMSKKVFIGVGHGGTDSGAVKYIVEKRVYTENSLCIV